MPTYEYRCPEGHEFEKFQRMSDEPVAECPECGERAERMLSAGAGFLFKGDGFYITDYRSESYRKAQKAERDATNGGKKSGSDAGKSSGSDGKGSDTGGAASAGSGGGKDAGATPKKGG